MSVQAIADAVERGEHPAVPENCLVDYANLMQSCWSENPRYGQSFDVIVRCIESMTVNSEE